MHGLQALVLLLADQVVPPAAPAVMMSFCAGWVSREDWLECGEGFLAEHRASNSFVATPQPRQEEEEEAGPEPVVDISV